MITVTPQVTVFTKDPSVQAQPAPTVLCGTDISCDKGALFVNDVLPAATSAAALPFPPGVSTAKVLVIVPLSAPDLVVTYKGQAIPVPVKQPLFLYGLAAADVSVSTVAGGQVAYLVGG